MALRWMNRTGGMYVFTLTGPEMQVEDFSLRWMNRTGGVYVFTLTGPEINVEYF